MSNCLICDAPIEPFISFGRMPIANGFLTPERFGQEFVYELAVAHCGRCQMVQLVELVDPAQLFHEEYAFFSSTSVYMARHFQRLAAMVQQTYLPAERPFVVEMGSNDGILLQNFAQAHIDHLGVEPSANVAQAAMNKGIQTLCRFFNEETAREIRGRYGPADAVLGANVICHLPNIHSVIRGVQHLLKDEGVFIFEEPYLGDVIAKTAYDQIYDEHVFYFSLHSLGHLLARYGLEIIDIAPQPVHGGSMRYVVGRQGARPVQPAVQEQWAMEEAMDLGNPASYRAFCHRVYQSREQLVGLLTDIRRQGKRIAGYGATSKSTTVTNFCGIGPDLVACIYDTTPGKQGKYNPGTHIPVLPYQQFSADYPDYALLFAWNHKREIVEKEQAFMGQGGQFIEYVPTVQVTANEHMALSGKRSYGPAPVLPA